MPIIAFNGLHIHYKNDPQQDEYVFFNQKIMLTMINDIKKNFVLKNIICATKKNVYVINKKNSVNQPFWMLNMNLICDSLEHILKNKVMNFIIEFKNKNFDREKLLKILQKYKYHDVCFWEKEYLGFVEIYHNNCNKYKAIMKIAKKMFIPKKNIIAFGNDFNDLEMLKKLPNAYVMKNANLKIKKQSHLITKFDNNHNGVMKELQFILKNSK